MKTSWLRAVFVLACLQFSACSSAPSGPTPSRPANAGDFHAALVASAGPFEQRLDAELAAQDYASIEQTVKFATQGPPDSLRARVAASELPKAAGDTPDSVDHLRLRVLNWGLLQETRGQTDTAFVSKVYAQALFAVAQYLPPEQQEKIRHSAATQYVRLLELITTEGAQCSNSNAPAARLREVTQDLQQVAAYAATLSSAEGMQVALDANLLVELRFAKRVPDRWMCGRGFVAVAAWLPERSSALRTWKQQHQIERVPELKVQKTPDVTALFGPA